MGCRGNDIKEPHDPEHGAQYSKNTSGRRSCCRSEEWLLWLTEWLVSLERGLAFDPKFNFPRRPSTTTKSGRTGPPSLPCVCIFLPTFIAAAISIPRRSLGLRHLRTCNPGRPVTARCLGKEPPHTTAHRRFIRNLIGVSPWFTARRDFHSLDQTSFSRHRRHLSQATGSFLRGWKIADRGGRFLRVIRYHDTVWQFPCAPSHNPISVGPWTVLTRIAHRISAATLLSQSAMYVLLGTTESISKP